MAQRTATHKMHKLKFTLRLFLMQSLDIIPKKTLRICLTRKPQSQEAGAKKKGKTEKAI